MAALVLLGAPISGCISGELVDEQAENNSKIVTLTTTVSLDGAATKALSIVGNEGVKTFAEGETMAIVYNNGASTVTTVSHTLEASDITDEGKTATFTFELEGPDKTKNVTYIYPAAMANSDGSINYDDLYAQQDGTLTKLGSTFDYCTKSGAWDGDNLPTLTLENQLSILAITLKNFDGDEITAGITGLTVSDGTNSYAVTRTAGEGPIYVAILPTASAKIWISATTGTVNYIKSLTEKTYEANYGYSVSWKMATFGDVILPDGTFAKAGTAGAVAMIAYVGSETCEAAYGFTHGLALAMSDANGGNGCKWRLNQYASHDLMQGSSSFSSESGLQYNNTENTSEFPAFQAAIANNGTAAPTGCSDWFLPSGYQWNKMITAAGGYTTLRISANLDQTSAACYYWSSSESGSTFAWRLIIYVNPSTSNDESGWSANDKVSNDFYLVRSALAF